MSVLARFWVTGLFLLLLIAIAACGEEATSTPAPAQSTPDAAPATTAPAPAATQAVAPTATTAPAPVTATPTAAPAATPDTTAEPTDDVPTGTLNVGMQDLASPVFLLHNQPFVEGRYDNIVTHDTMFYAAPNGDVKPRLVRDWTVDPAGTTFTFHLQQGVKWHQEYGDWGEFSADDFIWSLEDVAKEASPHAAAGNMRRLFWCDGCEVTKIDDYTVELKRPNPTFEITWWSRTPVPSGMSFHSQKHYEAVGEDVATNQQSVGSGSWELIEVRTGEFRRNRAVRDHWRNTPHWEEMVWWEVTEASTRLANFLTGIIDAGQFDLDSIQAIKSEDMEGVKFMSFSGGRENSVHLLGQNYYLDNPAHTGDNPRVPVGENAYDCTIPYVSCDRDINSEEWANALKVRTAMSLALDRQKMVNNLAHGEGEPWYLRFWSPFPDRVKEFGLDELTWNYDLAEAKRLLTEAGFPDGFEIEATLTPGASTLVTQAAATMLEDIGITTKQANMPYSAMRPSHVNRTAKGLWTQAFPASDVEPLHGYNILHNTGSAINFGFEHPIWQDLIDKANQTYDTEARWAVQAELARFMFDHVMALTVFSENIVWPLGARVGRWEAYGGNADWLSNWESAPHAN